VFLEILILAELAVRPAHGYELKKRIRGDMAGQVTLNSNTLYPALRRFTAAGLVSCAERRDPGRPPRQVYELTAAGQEHLHGCSSSSVPISPIAARSSGRGWRSSIC